MVESESEYAAAELNELAGARAGFLLAERPVKSGSGLGVESGSGSWSGLGLGPGSEMEPELEEPTESASVIGPGLFHECTGRYARRAPELAGSWTEEETVLSPSTTAPFDFAGVEERTLAEALESAVALRAGLELDVETEQLLVEVEALRWAAANPEVLDDAVLAGEAEEEGAGPAEAETVAVSSAEKELGRVTVIIRGLLERLEEALGVPPRPSPSLTRPSTSLTRST